MSTLQTHRGAKAQRGAFRLQENNMAISLHKLLESRELCFYDIETFYKYSCWVFKFPNDKWEIVEFWPEGDERNRAATQKLWNIYQSLLKSYILIGYNCKKYDNIILLKLFEYGLNNVVTAQDINDLSDQIISQQTLKLANIPEGFLSYDVYNFKNHMPSLKIVGTLFGGDIRETPIPFTFKGELTKEQIADVLYYCKHDVSITELIFNSDLGQKYYEMENKMAEIAFNEVRDECRPDFVYKLYSTACDHYEEIVKIKTKYNYKAPDDSPEDEFEAVYPDVLGKVVEFVEDNEDPLAYIILNQLIDFFYDEDSFAVRVQSGGKDKMKLDLNLRDDVEVSYGQGGAHGTTPYPLFVKSGNGFKILHADFSAMYPSIMIAYDFFPPGLPIHIKEIFKKFAKARDEYKKLGDKVSSDAYKPILNSVPGRFRYQFSKLYHPATNFSICALGQTLITAMSLIVKGRLIQVDTDGIMVLCTDEEYDINVDLISKFSDMIDLKIKVEPFQWFAQQNIHSYAFADADGNVDGIGGFLGGKSDWDPNLMGIADVVHRCLTRGISVRAALREHIKENGVKFLTIVSKTTAKFHAFTIQDFKTGEVSKFNNRYLLSVAVIGTEAVKMGFSPVSVLKEGEGKTQKISSFPPVVVNINYLSDKVPLEIIDLNFYADFIMSKIDGIASLVGIKA